MGLHVTAVLRQSGGFFVLPELQGLLTPSSGTVALFKCHLPEVFLSTSLAGQQCWLLLLSMKMCFLSKAIHRLCFSYVSTKPCWAAALSGLVKNH